MVNRKQTEGFDLCECGHKEFHHIKTSDGKYVCSMNCDCEYFKKKALSSYKIKDEKGKEGKNV